MSAAGLAVGPVHEAAEVVADPHLAARNMLVEMERPDGSGSVLVPGNPIKMSRVAEGPETRVPWVGEHTTEVLQAELDCSDAEIDALRVRRRHHLSASWQLVRYSVLRRSSAVTSLRAVRASSVFGRRSRRWRALQPG